MYKMASLLLTRFCSLIGRESRDSGNNDWHGIGYAFCPGHDGAPTSYLVLVFVSDLLPYVW